MSDDLKSWPPSRHAFEELKKTGKLKYGGIVKWSELEELLGIKDRTSWGFLSEWFSLRESFEADGFMVTESKQNKEGFRFLDRLEMADSVRVREHKKANDSLRKSLTLSKVPREGLSESEIKKLDYWESKAALLGATSKILLRKRSLPSPEMAVKSLRQYLEDGKEE